MLIFIKVYYERCPVKKLLRRSYNKSIKEFVCLELLIEIYVRFFLKVQTIFNCGLMIPCRDSHSFLQLVAKPTHVSFFYLIINYMHFGPFKITLLLTKDHKNVDPAWVQLNCFYKTTVFYIYVTLINQCTLKMSIL